MQAYRAHGHAAWLAVGERRTRIDGILEVPNPEPFRGFRRIVGALDRRLLRLGILLRRRRESVDHPGTRRLLDLAPEPIDVVHAHNLHGGYFDLRLLPAISRRA